MVQWWELPLASALIVSVGGLLMWLLHVRFKQLDKKFGGK
jgi:hypothetical protein